jgi:hypothetical protein
LILNYNYHSDAFSLRDGYALSVLNKT